MLPLGTLLPIFDLPIVPGLHYKKHDSIRYLDRISSAEIDSRPLLLMIICAHCPFVKHIEKEITSIASKYENEIQTIAVSSNSLITHPQDGPENLLLQAQTHSWNFPYLMDFDQQLAKALRAACTPDFFLFAPNSKGQHELKYRGQLDESTPGNNLPVTGEFLRLALDALLKKEEVSPDQKPSLGCNIKWNPGQEPSWFS